MFFIFFGKCDFCYLKREVRGVFKWRGYTKKISRRRGGKDGILQNVMGSPLVFAPLLIII